MKLWEWLVYVWTLPARHREFQGQLSGLIGMLNRIQEELDNLLSEVKVVGTGVQYIGHNTEVLKTIEAQISACKCMLTPLEELRAIPSGEREGPSVHLVSFDGKHRFERPWNHPDVADCVESGAFYVRKAE